VFRVDNLRRVLAALADIPQGVAFVRSDIYQLIVPKTHLHPATGWTDTTKAFLPHWFWLLMVDLALN